MLHWPVPRSYSRTIPSQKSPGSFWENRGDRYHCGVDIYAPAGSEVFAIKGGRILDISIATPHGFREYWNTTYSVLIQTNRGLYCRYAELGEVDVQRDGAVKTGDLIGLIGCVLNVDLIDASAPPYIQKLKERGNVSMLHFELYIKPPQKNHNYVGGNWFGKDHPVGLIDPTDYLKQLF